jgi:hypothetical protein
MDKVKMEKLLHYADREPKIFKQFDAFCHEEADCIMHPNEDGDVLFVGITVELMHGRAPVRVLIDPATDGIDVLRALKKIRKWIKHEPQILKVDTHHLRSEERELLKNKDDEPLAF